MSKVKLLTQAEYAAHRGCSAVAVHKAVKAGRISTIGGKIDPEVADIQWARNTRARVSAKATPADAPAVASDPIADVDGPADKARPGDTGYWDARTRREQAEASRAARADAEEAGLLIRVAAVRTAMGNAYVTTREAILNIPARLAPKLAVLTDPAEIQTLLFNELHAALTSLATATHQPADEPAADDEEGTAA